MQGNHIKKYENVSSGFEHIVHRLTNWNDLSLVVTNEVRSEPTCHEFIEEGETDLRTDFISCELDFSQMENGLIVPVNMVPLVEPENEHYLA